MILETIVTGPLQENCFVIADENALCGFVIDPGWNPERIDHVLKHYSIANVTILLTHGHFDHISAVGKLREMTGAKAYMSPLDDFLLDSVGGATAMMTGMGGVKGFSIDEPIAEGQVFTAGEITLKALATPGHSPGGISFYDGKEHVFAGDTIFRDSVGRVDFPQSSGPDLLSSILNVLYKLPDNTIVHCGHGPITTIGYEKKHNPYTLHPELLTGGLGSFL